jgi:hypothetical protein
MPADLQPRSAKIVTFLREERCHVVNVTDHTDGNLRFLDRSRYFSFKQLLIYSHWAEWTSFQTHYFSENLVASGIESGTSRSLTRNSDHYTIEAVENRDLPFI